MRAILSVLTILTVIPSAVADHFEHYTNTVFDKTISDKQFFRDHKELSSAQLGEMGDVLADASAAFLVVRTNDDRWCKLLVQPARQRFPKDMQVPMLLIEKYVTFKESTERTLKAHGEAVHLYPGVILNLDIGQFVPEGLGGDLTLELKGKTDFVLRPVGNAKLYVLRKPVPDVVPRKTAKLTVGATFETRYFNGEYKLFDDGRRSGRLKLEVNESGEVTGVFYSDRDGAKYDVVGKTGDPRHAIRFTIKFPQVEQSFSGFLFTGNGKAIAGTTKLQEREAGFYAERVEE